MQNMLVDDQQTFEGFTLYLIGDQGYPLLPWFIVPYQTVGHPSIVEALFNKKLRRGQCVVENAFSILKQTFKELLMKYDLHIAFLPDVIVACTILHNMLLGQSYEEVEHLFAILRIEGLDRKLDNDIRLVDEGFRVM